VRFLKIFSKYFLAGISRYAGGFSGRLSGGRPPAFFREARRRPQAETRGLAFPAKPANNAETR
jgi:hypothetical protein